MAVVKPYLYGSLDSDIHMKIPEELKFEEIRPYHFYLVKLE